MAISLNPSSLISTAASLVEGPLKLSSAAGNAAQNTANGFHTFNANLTHYNPDNIGRTLYNKFFKSTLDNMVNHPLGKMQSGVSSATQQFNSTITSPVTWAKNTFVSTPIHAVEKATGGVLNLSSLNTKLSQPFHATEMAMGNPARQASDAIGKIFSHAHMGSLNVENWIISALGGK